MNITRDITYGMYIVTSNNGKNVGCTINTLCQITSGDNPTITISLNKNNYTNEVIREKREFIVSIISEETNPLVISTFGFKTSKEIDKFENFEFDVDNDLPILKENTIGYIRCKVLDIVDCGTHDIFISEVINGDKFNNLVPMTYKYYHEVIKGKAPKTAPTFHNDDLELKTSESGEEVWVCSICGYVHKGPMSDDFKCPWCGQGKEKFNKKTN